MPYVADRLNTGDRFMSTFWTDGDIVYVEWAITEYRAAQETMDDKGEEAIRARLALADALRIHFEEGIAGDEQYSEALSLAETALADSDPSSELHLRALRVVGLVLCRRFHSRDPANIHRATAVFGQLVERSSSFGPVALVEALALQASTASLAWDDLEDPACSEPANDAIDRALSLLNGRHTYEIPDLALALSDSRFIRSIISPNPKDPEEAMETMRGLIQHTHPNHPRLFEYWNIVAVYYGWSHWHGGDPDYLDRSLEAYDHARRLVRTTHPYWHVIHGNYAEMLHTRFLLASKLRDLEEALAMNRAVVKHIYNAPTESRAGADIYVRVLGNMLQVSYSQTGKLELLDEAIALHTESLESTPPARRRYALGALGRSYRARFLTHKRLSDIDNAISLLSNALEGAPLDYDHAQASRNLAEAVLARYDIQGAMSDIETAISILEVALDSEYPKPEYRAHNYSLLGLTLLRRASVMPDSRIGMKDIKESVHYQKLALESFPHEHPLHAVTVFRLGLAEFEAYGRGHDRSALDRSIDSFSLAVSSTPDYHPDKGTYLMNLGRAQLALADEEGKQEIDDVLRTFERSAKVPASWTAERYVAAVEWAQVAHQRKYLIEAVEAYRLAISLLPQLAWLGLESELRMISLSRDASRSGLCQDAAACAIELGQLEVAIELIETSRSVLWNASQELRADVGRLKEDWPELAREVAETSAALEFRAQDETRSLSENEREVERRRIHRLASRWTELISLIRDKPGFDRFLLPPSFDELRAAAKNGPVVILNASSYRCDALLLPPDGQIILVPLPELRYHQLEKETSMLQRALRVAKDARGLQFLEALLLAILRRLWSTVGSRVWQALLETSGSGTTQKGRAGRLWWCPTGIMTFLPIHACGTYDGRHPGLSDLIISSYTPTLSALMRARNSASKPATISRKPLVICQPELVGRPPLPCALEELAILKAICPRDGTFLVGTEGTVSRVLSALPSHSWLHVSTHGSQNSLNPLESAIQLHDGPLKLSLIAQTRLPDAEFAFLSACHSAKGAEWLPDESMHLAAGLMFAGYRSVVATSWAIADQDAPKVASLFYGYLARHDRGVVLSDAAEALHMATKVLRDSGVPLLRWVPFIHLGV